jgi:nucleotide-binding universal stress UspA family protein
VTRPTILAATDGTARSRAVLGRAESIARNWDARLALVHVRKPANTRFRLRPKRVSEPDLAEDLLRHGGEREDLHMLDGPPSDNIVELAHRLGAALVVLGLHRERRVLDALRMTTMERITQGLACPVLVACTHPPRPYHKVLAALSFDPICAPDLASAARLAPDAVFRAIHAIPPRAADTKERRAQAMQRAEALGATYMNCPGLPADMPRPEIVAGGVHEVLHYRMSEFRPDLLVIGSHSGRDPARLGNYARDLMRAPPTDVLVTTPDPANGVAPLAGPMPTVGS